MKVSILILCLVAIVSAEGFEKGNERIAGGVESTPNSHPYQVGLQITSATGPNFCGGSLISRNFVLTAAHCVDGSSSVTVVLGAHNINNDPNKIEVVSTEAIVHPDFIPRTLLNDIALVKLPNEVTLNERIGLLNMPPRSTVNHTFVIYDATVTGWGRTSDSSEATSQILREVTTPIISTTSCNLRYLGTIQPSQVCASGADGKSSCIGDEGGPLTVMFSGTKIQIGIVSFGVHSGCEVGWPPVSTRITSYLDWISETAGITIT